MREHPTSPARFLSTLVATAVTAALAAACGTSGTNGGVDSGSGSSGGSSSGGSGCGSPMQLPVNNALCQPQLASTLTCNGQVCSWEVEVPCLPDAGVADAGGTDAAAEPPCMQWCMAVNPGVGFSVCAVTPTDAGQPIRAQCGACGLGGGRPPKGFVARRVSAQSDAGEALAQMAQFEAASVGAFRALHADLTRLGAPPHLLHAVGAAARDEVRHARSVRRAAKRFGATVPRTRLAPVRPRSLEQLAIENAEEGCVKETFGAAVAALQASRATDARLRRTMRRIARDEMRHAALSWHLATWFEARLGAPARSRVRQARRSTVTSLRRQLASVGAGIDAIGLPDARVARAALDAVEDALTTGKISRSAA